MKRKERNLEENEKKVLLFACVHNSGRSVAARVIAEKLGGDKIIAISRGSEPSDSINKVVREELEKRGYNCSNEVPELLDIDSIKTADYVITMGCGENCPYVPGKKYLDWIVEDPKDKTAVKVANIIDDIESRVKSLLLDIG